ncbi:Cysteine-rich protein 2-binding protein [Smittium mucronatum]|uniref:Cysteine-rich protein 2-binding protein n=1 Tax=Smittium mucronatum TaxID=133383 RepID=A0A1R0GQR4_9FUNG|nr:Cysteine-rich protein 2-binding protein [Smittium mucronatum]
MYHLKVENPETLYFRWREHICAKFDQYWEFLIPEKIRTPTWQNTVAGCISTHNGLFKSGLKDTGQTGFWSLRTLAPPSKDGFKFPTRSKQDINDQRVSRTKKKPLPETASKPKPEIISVINPESPSSIAQLDCASKNHKWSLKHSNLPGSFYDILLNELVEARLNRTLSSDESSLSDSDVLYWSSDSDNQLFKKNKRVSRKTSTTKSQPKLKKRKSLTSKSNETKSKNQQYAKNNPLLN